MIRKIILLAAMIGITVSGAAQFNKAVGNASLPYQMFGSKMIRTADGGYIQIGTNYNYNSGDFQVVRMNSAGTILWKRHYGLADDMETATCLAQLADGTIVIGGWTSFDGGASEFSSYFIRIAPSNGYLYWSQVVPSPLWTSVTNHAEAICATDDNAFIVAGTWGYDSFTQDMYAFKMTSLGVLHWQKTYHFTDPVDGSCNSSGKDVSENADGTLIMTGGIYSSGGQGTCLMKLTSSGTVTWAKKYSAGTGTASGYSVVQTSDGGYAVSGAGAFKNHICKTDGSGNLSWSKLYGTDAGYGNDIIQTSDGGYAVASGSALLKLGSTGALSWAKGYHGSVLSVVQLTTGEYAMGGYTNEFGFPLGAFLQVKTDAAGDGCGALPAIITNTPHTTTVTAMTVSASGPLTFSSSSPLTPNSVLSEVSMCNCTVDAGTDKTNQARNSCCVPSGCSSVSIGTAAVAGYTYLWTPSSTLSCSTCAQPNANPCATTTYKVTASGTGCLSSYDYVTVTSIVVDCCDPKRLAGPDGQGDALVSVYPNPAHDMLTIELNKNMEPGQEVHIEVTDLQGKQMLTQEYLSDLQIYQLDLSGLSAGMYLVTITTGENCMTQKISIE